MRACVRLSDVAIDELQRTLPALCIQLPRDDLQHHDDDDSNPDEFPAPEDWTQWSSESSSSASEEDDDNEGEEGQAGL